VPIGILSRGTGFDPSRLPWNHKPQQTSMPLQLHCMPSPSSRPFLKSPWSISPAALIQWPTPFAGGAAGDDDGAGATAAAWAGDADITTAATRKRAVTATEGEERKGRK